mgnify:CR=1 FL=1
MGDNDTPAGDAPELAGTATADTESVYAWALDEEGDTEELPRRLTPRRITALAVGASLARAAAVAVATLRPGADPAVAPPTQTRATLPPPAASAIPVTQLDQPPTRTRSGRAR